MTLVLLEEQLPAVLLARLEVGQEGDESMLCGWAQASAAFFAAPEVPSYSSSERISVSALRRRADSSRAMLKTNFARISG